MARKCLPLLLALCLFLAACGPRQEAPQDDSTLDLVATTSVDRSELLYRQEQIRQFFANSGTKLILAAVLVVAVLVLLRLLVFRKRRRYRAGAGAGGRRGSYHGRRRR